MKVVEAYLDVLAHGPASTGLTEPQVELLLAEALNAHIYGAGSWLIWSTPPLQGQRGALVAPTLGLCEDFVLAHEIGHVLAGDRLEATYMSAPVEAPVPGLDIPVADCGAEFAADRMGAEIVRATFGVDESIGPMDERSLCAGLLFFFFLIDEVVRSTKKPPRRIGRGAPVWHGHYPPARCRTDGTAGDGVPAASRQAQVVLGHADEHPQGGRAC